MFHVLAHQQQLQQHQQWTTACAVNAATMSTPSRAPVIIRVVASVLEKLIGGNTMVAVQAVKIRYDPAFMKFQSSYIPEVSIESYLERIRRYSRCSDACFVMALVYVDKLIESSELVLTSLNVHRLLITSVMLAAKFHDDLFYNNAYYAKLGGLSLQELNLLEIDILHQLKFSLFISGANYAKYHLQLRNYVFYLDAIPPPTASLPAATAIPAAVVDALHYQNIFPDEQMSVSRIPSPENPHAKSHYGFILQDEAPLLCSVPTLSLDLRQQQQQQQCDFYSSCSASTRMVELEDNYSNGYVQQQQQRDSHSYGFGYQYVNEEEESNRFDESFIFGRCSSDGVTTVGSRCTSLESRSYKSQMGSCVSSKLSRRFSPEAVAVTAAATAAASSDTWLGANQSLPVYTSCPATMFVPDHLQQQQQQYAASAAADAADAVYGSYLHQRDNGFLSRRNNENTNLGTAVSTDHQQQQYAQSMFPAVAASAHTLQRPQPPSLPNNAGSFGFDHSQRRTLQETSNHPIANANAIDSGYFDRPTAAAGDRRSFRYSQIDGDCGITSGGLFNPLGGVAAADCHGSNPCSTQLLFPFVPQRQQQRSSMQFSMFDPYSGQGGQFQPDHNPRVSAVYPQQQQHLYKDSAAAAPVYHIPRPPQPFHGSSFYGGVTQDNFARMAAVGPVYL